MSATQTSWWIAPELQKDRAKFKAAQREREPFMLQGLSLKTLDNPVEENLSKPRAISSIPAGFRPRRDEWSPWGAQ